jgi:hypothetical protein
MVARRQRSAKLRVGLLIGLVALLLPRPLSGYGVLSHEELIDISWQPVIRPALLKRYPQATPEELKAAHAYAYGGSVIQDLGYYPFGSHDFTNLLHYVRTGNFVGWMLRDARDVNEYAFALGALSHYAADVWGHPAVNAGVAIEYPKLRKKFGREVTYEENPEAHLKTEFSFDVVQVAKRRYISKEFHDFIGFQVSDELLARAFADTYGITVDSLLHWDDLTIESYRFSVSRVIPEMTQVALASREHHVHEENNQAKKQFLYHLSRADYEKEFGAKYRKPGIFARILAFLLRLIPKFGPFKALAYKDPNAITQDLYFRSMNQVVAQYRNLVNAAEKGDLSFANRNLDTGRFTAAGEYYLADQAYARLARKLREQNFANVTPQLRQSILSFFANGPGDRGLKKKEWRETQEALAALAANQAHPDTHEQSDKRNDGGKKPEGSQAPAGANAGPEKQPASPDVPPE